MADTIENQKMKLVSAASAFVVVVGAAVAMTTAAVNANAKIDAVQSLFAASSRDMGLRLTSIETKLDGVSRDLSESQREMVSRLAKLEAEVSANKERIAQEINRK